MSLKTKIEAELFSLSGVVAIKVLDDEVKVWTSKPELVPDTMYGKKVIVIYTPPVRPLEFRIWSELVATEEKRTAKFRPCPGGVSIGNYNITAGTLASRVFDLDGRKLLLSNYHIFTPDGAIDELILQPGKADGGTLEDTIAISKRYVPLKFNDLYAENYCDAAVAEPIKQEDILDEILDLGIVEGVDTVKEGDVITKSGRSCGVKSGKVLEKGVNIKVDGYKSGYAVFRDQIITEPILMPGDSGSLGVKNGKAVALGFAGSAEVSVFSPIKYVISGLKISFGEPSVVPEDKQKLSLILSGIMAAPLAVGVVISRGEKHGWM